MRTDARSVSGSVEEMIIKGHMLGVVNEDGISRHMTHIFPPQIASRYAGKNIPSQLS